MDVGTVISEHQSMLNTDTFIQIPIAFESPILRGALYPGEDTSNNNFFNLSIEIPEGFDKLSHKHILIMVNGMGEFLEWTYLDRRRGLCSRFHELGIATCFMPLPYHFSRMSDVDQRQLKDERKKRKIALKQSGETAPFSHPTVLRIIEQKSRFYLGYEQLRWDLGLLTSIINKSKRQGVIPTDTKISLWGFSIGGLGVLGHFFEKSKLYHSCILAHSGANFETLGLNRDILTEDQWIDMKECWGRIGDCLKNKNPQGFLQEMPELHSLNLNEFRKFATIFLGYNKKRLLRLTNRHSDKILLFIGGDDDVNSLTSVMGTLIPKAGLAVHTIPGLRHNIHTQDSFWLRYQIAITKVFLDKHPV